MELLHIANGDYPRYEELLLKRESVKKEALKYKNEYALQFGTLITAVFEAKIKCIELKKKIAFYQMKLNYGEKVNEEDMQEYIEECMQEYYIQLDLMICEKNSVKLVFYTDEELSRIKKLHSKLARQLHPDLNPLVNDNCELLGLWYRLTSAYENSDLEELEEIEVLVQRIFDKLGIEHIKAVIPNIKEKISALETEILHIMKTEPYTYKLLLEDTSAVNNKKAELNKEISEYDKYKKELKSHLNYLKGLNE